MKNYLLTILFIIAGHKLSAWCDVSGAHSDIIKLSLHTEEEHSKKKINEIHPEDQEKNLHANSYSSLIAFDAPLIHFPKLNSHIERNFVDHPFTPPDLI